MTFKTGSNTFCEIDVDFRQLTYIRAAIKIAPTETDIGSIGQMSTGPSEQWSQVFSPSGAICL